VTRIHSIVQRTSAGDIPRVYIRPFGDQKGYCAFVVRLNCHVERPAAQRVLRVGVGPRSKKHLGYVVVPATHSVVKGPIARHRREVNTSPPGDQQLGNLRMTEASGNGQW
jgi:hypothetical protein